MAGVGEGDEDDGESGEESPEPFSVPTRASDYDPAADYKVVEVSVSSFTDLAAKNGKKYTVYNVETFNRWNGTDHIDSSHHSDQLATACRSLTHSNA